MTTERRDMWALMYGAAVDAAWRVSLPAPLANSDLLGIVEQITETTTADDVERLVAAGRYPAGVTADRIPLETTVGECMEELGPMPSVDSLFPTVIAGIDLDLDMPATLAIAKAVAACVVVDVMARYREPDGRTLLDNIRFADRSDPDHVLSAKSSHLALVCMTGGLELGDRTPLEIMERYDDRHAGKDQ